MGDNHPHRGCHGGGTGNLGVCRIADMAGARIMSPLNYPVHHSGCVRMKRSLLAHRLLNPLGFVVFKMGALPKLSRNPPKRKDWPDWPCRGVACGSQRRLRRLQALQAAPLQVFRRRTVFQRNLDLSSPFSFKEISDFG
jgi:hypothetical protein